MSYNLVEETGSLLITADGSESDARVTLLNEHELDIIINEHFAVRLICTREHLRELVLGCLLTGGFIESADDVDKLIFCRSEEEASVFLKKDIEFEEAASEEKSCCTGNKALLAVKDRKPFRKLPRQEFENEWIFAMARYFAGGMPLHDMTASAHSCILSRHGAILFICEDIGRHNAMDKAIGYGIKAGIPLSECILYTSGRVPVDMAEKAIAAGVPILASKSLPTSNALSLARKYGLTIIGNARPDSMKVF